MRTDPDYILAEYRIRILTCVAAALLVVLGAVHLWPLPDVAETRPVYRNQPLEAIQLEEIHPTRQADAVPAPPAPPIPILVPDDYELEETTIEFSDNLLPVDDPGEDAEQGEGDSDESSGEPGVTVGPKTVRFVEPEYTREARRRRIRAELVVRVLVDEHGQVEEATIVERFLINQDGITKTPVSAIGYGIEDAALSAADRWMFRPARKDGMPVASHTLLVFSFGVDA